MAKNKKREENDDNDRPSKRLHVDAKKLDIEATNSFGDSLHLAVKEGKFELVKLLVEKGANVDALDNNRKTALYYAWDDADYNLIEFLVTNGADPNVWDKAWDDSDSDSDSDNDDYDDDSDNDGKGTTLLHFVCSEEKFELAELLVKKGANVKAIDKNGKTALHFAAEQQKFELAKLLVEKGANVNAQDINGSTPLHLACAETKNYPLIEFLVTNGADLEININGIMTPLNVACFKSKRDFVKLLVEKNADVNAKELTVGNTPLHWACMRGMLDSVKLLIEKGADTNVQNAERKTPGQFIVCSKEDLELYRKNFLESPFKPIDFIEQEALPFLEVIKRQKSINSLKALPKPIVYKILNIVRFNNIKEFFNKLQPKQKEITKMYDFELSSLVYEAENCESEKHEESLKILGLITYNS